MKPRPRPHQLQRFQPWPRCVPPARSFPSPPLLPPVLLLLLPGFPLLLPIVLSPSFLFLHLPCLPLIPGPSSFCRSVCPPRLHFPSATPCPSPVFLCGSPSPPPSCPVWPKDKSQEGNQERQTRCSDFIIVVNLPLQFLPQGSKPAQLELRTDKAAETVACLCC